MLKFIGCGSAFNTALGNNVAYIKEDNVLFMIDCGSSTFDRLLKSELLDGIEHIYVLLTHTHPDHVGSLGDLIFYGYYAMGEVGKPKVTVLSPFNIEIHSLLRLNGVEHHTYKLVQFHKYIDLAHDDFNIEIDMVEVKHVEELDCYGYILKYKDNIAYYSGDTNEIPSHILHDLHNGGFDLFYQDTCKADYEGNVHLSLNKLNELVDIDVRHKVFCMHLDKGFDREEAEKMGFGVVNFVEANGI